MLYSVCLPPWCRVPVFIILSTFIETFFLSFGLSLKFLFAPSRPSCLGPFLTSYVSLSPRLLSVLAGSCLLHITICLFLSSYPFFFLMCSRLCSPTVFLFFAPCLTMVLKIKLHHKLVTPEPCLKVFSLFPMFTFFLNHNSPTPEPKS